MTFYALDPDPNWDGTHINIKYPSAGAIEIIALVEFKGYRSAKLGGPNEEVFHGHPLYRRGLEVYQAQIYVSGC